MYVSPTAKPRHAEHPVHAFSSPPTGHLPAGDQLCRLCTLHPGFLRGKNFSDFTKYCPLQTGCGCSSGSCSLLPSIYLPQRVGDSRSLLLQIPHLSWQTVHASSGSRSIFVSSAISHTDGSCSISHRQSSLQTCIRLFSNAPKVVCDLGTVRALVFNLGDTESKTHGVFLVSARKGIRSGKTCLPSSSAPLMHILGSFDSRMSHARNSPVSEAAWCCKWSTKGDSCSQVQEASVSLNPKIHAVF